MRTINLFHEYIKELIHSLCYYIHENIKKRRNSQYYDIRFNCFRLRMDCQNLSIDRVGRILHSTDEYKQNAPEEFNFSLKLNMMIGTKEGLFLRSWISQRTI